MPNRSKQKGDRCEREIVELFLAAGLEAYRVPLSGAATGFKSDVEVRLPGTTLKLESKVRGTGFGRIYKWLIGNDGVVIKADREQTLLVIPLERFARLLGASSYLPQPQSTPNQQALEQQQNGSLELPQGKQVLLNAGKPTIRV